MPVGAAAVSSLPAFAKPTPTQARLRQLAGALAFASRLGDSPYASDLKADELRDALLSLFMRECLAMRGHPPKPALETLVEVGSMALPKLAKMAIVLKDKYVDLWRNGDTIPLDMDLPADYQFHSIFVCPISKEVSTPGNPPTRLPCGHVLALNSVTKLSRGSRTARFKCPYCPMECSSEQTQALTI